MILRRRLLALLASSAAMRPLVGFAQAKGMRRIAALIPYAESDPEAKHEVEAFRDALRQFGWKEGGNLRSDYRWVTGGIAEIEAAARELVALEPEVILARTTPVTAALLRATRKIPIVFVVVSDPVGDRFVESLARPGGNVTGFTNVESSLGGKWLELLKEIAPRVTRVAVLFNPKTAPGGGKYYWRLVESAAPKAGVKVHATEISNAAEVEQAVGAFAREPNGGLLVLPDFTTRRLHREITALAARHRLPAIYSWRLQSSVDGLLSYGIDYAELYRQAAGYFDRVLRGERPGDLPVQAPSKFRLTISRKTAGQLGLSIPRTLALRADELVD